MPLAMGMKAGEGDMQVLIAGLAIVAPICIAAAVVLLLLYRRERAARYAAEQQFLSKKQETYTLIVRTLLELVRVENGVSPFANRAAAGELMTLSRDLMIFGSPEVVERYRGLLGHLTNGAANTEGFAETTWKLADLLVAIRDDLRPEERDTILHQ